MAAISELRFAILEALAEGQALAVNAIFEKIPAPLRSKAGTNVYNMAEAGLLIRHTDVSPMEFSLSPAGQGGPDSEPGQWALRARLRDAGLSLRQVLGHLVSHIHP